MAQSLTPPRLAASFVDVCPEPFRRPWRGAVLWRGTLQAGGTSAAARAGVLALPRPVGVIS
jgi:hypothetical protein